MRTFSIYRSLILFLLFTGCKKEENEGFVPKPPTPDHRLKYAGKYQMRFAMSSSNNQTQPETVFNDTTTMICTVRLTTPQDTLASVWDQYPNRTLMIEGIPFLNEQSGNMYQTRYVTDVNTSGGNDGNARFTSLFRNDSLYFHVYFGQCYGKYYHCVSKGSGKRMQ
jgi:hypothetical protein